MPISDSERPARRASARRAARAQPSERFLTPSRHRVARKRRICAHESGDSPVVLAPTISGPHSKAVNVDRRVRRPATVANVTRSCNAARTAAFQTLSRCSSRSRCNRFQVERPARAPQHGPPAQATQPVQRFQALGCCLPYADATRVPQPNTVSAVNRRDKYGGVARGGQHGRLTRQ